jgi:hypothetical protein
MIGRWQWVLKRIARRLWFRAGLLSALGVVTALLALGVKDYIPESLSAHIGADAVDNILGITCCLTGTCYSRAIVNDESFGNEG